jgi:hypothetical protein
VNSQRGDRDLLCPSARCASGALLLGVVGRDGRIGYLRPAIAVDPEFAERAAAGRAPEKRFRFAQPCARNGCQHWQGQRCAVADAAVKLEPASAAGHRASLPRCGIRRDCRWFAQRGRLACAACPLVVTDVRGGLVARPDEVASGLSLDPALGVAEQP